jgi:hypothetical protein
MDIDSVRALLKRSQPQLTDEILVSASYEFADSYLMCDKISDAHVDLVAELLSDPLYGRFEATCHFLLDFETDREKLSAAQRDRIARTLIANVEIYSHWLLRHTAGDFVANMFPPHEAIGYFAELTELNSNASKHAAFVGLELVLKQLERDRIDSKDSLVVRAVDLFKRASTFEIAQ